MKRLAGSLLLALACATAATADDVPAGPEAVQDVIFLGENRPIFLRLRMKLAGTPFREAWMDSVKTLHQYLDRDGNGTVSRDEADKSILATLTRVANGGATAMPRADLDNHPKDGVVSLAELADGLQSSLGPFRVDVGKLANGKTDALFDRLDVDGDGTLTKAELKSASASLQRFDLDDDELIDALEVEPFSNPLAMQTNDTPSLRARISAVPPVLEMEQGEPTLRPVRLLLKRYDKGTGNGTGSSAGDNKLSLAEFALPAAAFAKADADGDGALGTEELRRFLAHVTPDMEVDVALASGSASGSTVTITGGSTKTLPAGVKVKPLGGGDVEIAVDEVRLEIHIDNAEDSVASAKQTFMNQFTAADTDNNGYLEKSELTKDENHPSPLASLFDLLDRDGDGKVYPKEMDAFVETQAEAAKSRMVMSSSDQGRAIFAILDEDRDRRLGIREIRDTLARVASWDRDGDGKITAEEIPHHYHLTIGRAGLAGVSSNNAAVPLSMTPPSRSPAKPGPRWFVRMDRNKDGDISRREFLGPRSHFDRMDRDHDDLISADEADAPKETTAKVDAPANE